MGQPFLTMHQYHLSVAKARTYVLKALERMGGRQSNVDWLRGEVTLSDGESAIRLRFTDMEKEARQTGVVKALQRPLDRQDSIFGTAVRNLATPNSNLGYKGEYAGWRGEFNGPGRISSAVEDLTDDILFYRREACAASADYSFADLARHYRAYLSACVSIVDAFVNRHILLASHDGFESDEFTRLKEARGMDAKVDLWVQVCCSPRTFGHLTARKEWSHFQELRKDRNAIMHAVEPFAIYELRNIEKMLNHTRTGIGDLLYLLREWHKKPSVHFIERLRTAPMVEFHALSFKAVAAPQA